MSRPITASCQSSTAVVDVPKISDLGRSSTVANWRRCCTVYCFNHGLNLRHVPSLHGLNLRHVPSFHGLNLRHVPSLHGLNLRNVPSLHGLNLRHVPSLNGLNLRHVPSLHGLNLRHVPSLHGLNLCLDNRTVTESIWAMTDLPSPFSLYQLDYTYYNTNSNVA